MAPRSITSKRWRGPASSSTIRTSSPPAVAEVRSRRKAGASLPFDSPGPQVLFQLIQRDKLDRVQSFLPGRLHVCGHIVGEETLARRASGLADGSPINLR